MATFRKRGGHWQVQVRRRGATLSKTFIKRQDAQKWASQAELDADRKAIGPNWKLLERVTAADLFERFKTELVPRRRSGHVERVIIDAVLRQSWTLKPLSEISTEIIANYRDQRLRVVKPATVIRELGLIQHIFEIARTDWNIPLVDNPVRAIRKPSAGRPRDRRLKSGELDRLLKAAQMTRNRFLKPLILFALETGMRRGELLNAIWGDVSWRDSTIRIPVTKNGDARTIPLSTKARYILAELAFDFWSGARIFPTSSEAVKLAWKRLTTRARIPDLHFHDLRHEAVTRFFELGLSLPEVALISGHRDPRMLFRYTHLNAATLADKLSKLQKLDQAK